MAFPKYYDPDAKKFSFVHEPRNRHEQMHERIRNSGYSTFLCSFDLERISKILGSINHFER